jgi:citrate synthase
LTTRRGARQHVRIPNPISASENGKLMQIGRPGERASAISTSNEERIIVRGHDLCADLIGRIGFTEHVWLLLTGDLPTPPQRRVLDATLVAIAEHGLVPSVQASRMTYAAAPEALQGAVAAGLLGCGSVILGAAEQAGHLLQKVVARTASTPLEQAAADVVREYRADGRVIPGYGHPLHKKADPRAARLLALAREVGCDGRHAQAALAIEAALPAITGKPLVMNVSGAIPAVLLDAGYPLLALKGVPILARTASLVAHLLEEQQRPIGFALSEAGAAAIAYDGAAPAGFEPGDGARTT